MTRGAAALSMLAEDGRWRIDPGLSTVELDALESRFLFQLPPDHRDFLAAGLPVGPGWPDWRSGDELMLRTQIGRPVRALLTAVRQGQLWHPGWGEHPGEQIAVRVASDNLAKQPRVIPIYQAAFISQGSADPVVWQVQGGEVIPIAADLLELARLLTDRPVTPPEVGADRPFLPAPAVLNVPALDAPPFSPDPVMAGAAAVVPPKDPVATFADLGVQLPALSRHDDVTAHGAPLWTTTVEPGPTALALWQALRDAFPRTGLWPVLFTARSWHRIGLDGLADDISVLSADLDGARWLTDEFRSRTADYDVARYEKPFRSHADDADWRALFDEEREYDQLALVPTPADWLVPGLLQWSGAVNYDVDGIAHAAVLRRWSGRYRTELVALDHEFLTLRVGEPPRSEQAALTAALEAWLYCDDAVNTQAGSLDALAEFLTYRLWTFWWD